MAPRKLNEKNDLNMSNRLVEERKKIWKSREKYRLDTELSSRTLEAYETNKCEVSSATLKEIAIRGGDVHYILTGERKGESGGENKAVDMQLVKKLQAENEALRDALTAMKQEAATPYEENAAARPIWLTQWDSTQKILDFMFRIERIRLNCVAA